MLIAKIRGNKKEPPYPVRWKGGAGSQMGDSVKEKVHSQSQKDAGIRKDRLIKKNLQINNRITNKLTDATHVDEGGRKNTLTVSEVGESITEVDSTEHKVPTKSDECQPIKQFDVKELDACGEWISQCHKECTCSETNAELIPRIVHFIKDDNLTFSDWLAIAAARKYITPIEINLFTRKDTTPNCWMRRLKLIGRVNIIKLSTAQWLDNLNNVSVTHVEHQSDLLRNAILYHYGGIYMDTDAFATKTFDHILSSNHSVVLGRNLVNRIGNGLIVSRRHSCLMCEYGSQACYNFDGSWTKHSTVSLSNLMESNTTDYNVLILNYTSGFFPFSWKIKHFHELFDDNSTTIQFSPTQVYALHLFGSKFSDMISKHFSNLEWIKTGQSILARHIRTLIDPELLNSTHLNEDLCLDLPHNLLKYS